MADPAKCALARTVRTGRRCPRGVAATEACKGQNGCAYPMDIDPIRPYAARQSIVGGFVAQWQFGTTQQPSNSLGSGGSNGYDYQQTLWGEAGSKYISLCALALLDVQRGRYVLRLVVRVD